MGGRLALPRAGPRTSPAPAVDRGLVLRAARAGGAGRAHFLSGSPALRVHAQGRPGGHCRHPRPSAGPPASPLPWLSCSQVNKDLKKPRLCWRREETVP